MRRFRLLAEGRALLLCSLPRCVQEPRRAGFIDGLSRNRHAPVCDPREEEARLSARRALGWPKLTGWSATSALGDGTRCSLRPVSACQYPLGSAKALSFTGLKGLTQHISVFWHLVVHWSRKAISPLCGRGADSRLDMWPPLPLHFA